VPADAQNHHLAREMAAFERIGRSDRHVTNRSPRGFPNGTANWFENHITYEKGPTGWQPHWRCIRDDKGRIMVAICHNMDLGDGWENADEPRYEAKWTMLAYRVGINYFVYLISLRLAALSLWRSRRRISFWRFLKLSMVGSSSQA
jgi:hypothetical protein